MGILENLTSNGEAISRTCRFRLWSAENVYKIKQLNCLDQFFELNLFRNPMAGLSANGQTIPLVEHRKTRQRVNDQLVKVAARSTITI